METGHVGPKDGHENDLETCFYFLIAATQALKGSLG